MQLAAIHRKLYGFRKNKICPYNARSIPARHIPLSILFQKNNRIGYSVKTT